MNISFLKKTQDDALPPVITVDGPSGTGKGTTSHMLAKALGWHYLDSGALYRVLAHAAFKQKFHIEDLKDEEKLQCLTKNLHVEFLPFDDEIKTLLDGTDITHSIRTESCGNAASKIAVLPTVRHALLATQRAFRKWPGLVTDGRDMGTVVFPEAQLKFFLQASPEERAKRRYKQLKSKEVHVSLQTVFQDLEQRDARDKERGVAPLKPACDAILIDTTELSVEEVFDHLMQCIESHQCDVNKH